jgi:hypothetical protein
VNLNEFFALLADEKFEPQETKRSELVEFANAIFAARTSFGQDDCRWLIAQLKPIARLPSQFKSAIANHLLFRYTDDPVYFVGAIKASLLDGAGIEGRVANMNALAGGVFNAARGAEIIRAEFSRARFRSYYENTVSLIDSLLGRQKVVVKQIFQPNSRVVVLTQQFLESFHAPTKDALEFAWFLSQNYAKEVMIVSSCEYSSHPSGSVLPLALSRVLQDYANEETVSYKDKVFRYFQPQKGRFSLETIPQTVAAIEAFDPAMILVVGGRNLLAELFVKRAFVLFYPTTSKLPMLSKPNFFMWREPTVAESSLLDSEGLRTSYLFHQHPGFEVPTQKISLSRKDWYIPEDAFVFAVVGVRLDADIKSEFLDMLEDVIHDPRAYIVFAGHFSGYRQVVASRESLADRCRFLGFQDDIMAVYSICNCYLNPRRTGGGSAIVYALAAGLPSLSCPVGDGYEAVRKLPLLPNYEAMAKTCKKLMNNPDTVRFYRALATQEAARLCSRAPLVERIQASYRIFLEKTMHQSE